jgi:hypothetical protein
MYFTVKIRKSNSLFVICSVLNVVIEELNLRFHLMCVVRTAFTSQISFTECIWFGFCDFTEAYQPSQFQDSLFSLFSSQDTTSRLFAFYRRFSTEKFHYSQFLTVITYLNKSVVFIKQTTIQYNVKCLKTKTITST